MIVAMIVPTGIGAEIGGHAGDATAAAKLLAKCCDTLIGHPNIFNASDLNEMPENCLYVEGGLLDRFLSGHIELEPVQQNKILLVVNKLNVNTINSVAAARHLLGADIEILVLDHELIMKAKFEPDGSASGTIGGIEDLIRQVKHKNFDALAIQTPITCDPEVALHYANHGGVNPWGGVEAIVSRAISLNLNKPVAHAPIEFNTKFLKIVDSRMAAEFVSISYLHCILKGLHKAPRVGKGISKIDVLVTPHGCFGPPHIACLNKGIPIIAVRENKTIYNEEYDFIYVDNYLEAAGHLMCMQAGVLPEYVRRQNESSSD